MLVFSRKRGESVAVGERDEREQLLKVTVLEILQSRVKLGFEAPNDVPVHRWEVWQRINGNGGNLSQDPPAPKNSADRWEDEGGSQSRSQWTAAGAQRVSRAVSRHLTLKQRRTISDIGVCKHRTSY